MTANGYLQLALYLVVLIALAKPLGAYMARIYEGEPALLNRIGAPVEKLLYRLCGVDPAQEMRWTQYALAMLLVQPARPARGLRAAALPGACCRSIPQDLGAVSPDSSFNTAVSFATNTNWQGYGGETTMSYLTQMLGLTVQNFVSAASGMATLVALIRGFTRKSANTIGNFWVDLTRSTLYILLPLSTVLALVLVSQGVRADLLRLSHGAAGRIGRVRQAEARRRRPAAEGRQGPAGHREGRAEGAGHRRRARSPRRSRSSSSAPTAAASSTSTRRIRSRTRRRCPTSSRCWRSC